MIEQSCEASVAKAGIFIRICELLCCATIITRHSGAYPVQPLTNYLIHPPQYATCQPQLPTQVLDNPLNFQHNKLNHHTRNLKPITWINILTVVSNIDIGSVDWSAQSTRHRTGLAL